MSIQHLLLSTALLASPLFGTQTPPQNGTTSGSGNLTETAAPTTWQLSNLQVGCYLTLLLLAVCWAAYKAYAYRKLADFVLKMEYFTYENKTIKNTNIICKKIGNLKIGKEGVALQKLNFTRMIALYIYGKNAKKIIDGMDTEYRNAATLPESFIKTMKNIFGIAGSITYEIL